MQTLATTLMLVASFGAEPRLFPYEAEVERKDTKVYSGPGDEYYTTGLLHRGEIVTVYRHDAGGWYMISPPEESFNLIRANAVQLTGPRRGEVTDFDVPVFIGSETEPTRIDIHHQTLTKGDPVEVLEEVTIRKSGQIMKMYKIRPPKNEVRWIKGQTVVPVEGHGPHQQVADLFEEGERFKGTPSRKYRAYEDNAFHDDSSETWEKDVHNERRHPRDNDHHHDEDQGHHGNSRPHEDFGKKPVVRTKDGAAVRRNYPEQEELDADRARLQELDDRFREIIDRDASTWDFRELEHDYRRLQEEVSVPALASQIQLRFGSIDHYRELKHAYHDYIQLTSATSQRDAELLNVQRAGDPNPGGVVAYHTVGPEYQPHPPRWGMPRQFPSNGVPYPTAGPAPIPAEQYQVASGPALAAPEPSYEPVVSGPQLGAPTAASGPAVAQPTFVEPHPVSPTSGPVPYPTSIQPLPPGAPSENPEEPVASPSQYPVAPPAGSFPPPQSGPSHRTSQFDGAGIIQRAVGSPPGGPQHVLLTPNGRVLAYLQATPGVNLDAYVGRAMGLHGQRTHRPDLQGELLIVNDAVPVRLKQP